MRKDEIVATPEKRRFETPDDSRSFPDGKADIVSLGGHKLMLLTFQPGFRWSKSIGAQSNTDSCEVHHVWYVVSGRMHVRMNDGSEQEYSAGDLADVPAGHDGWTVGNESTLLLDVEGGAGTFGKF